MAAPPSQRLSLFMLDEERFEAPDRRPVEMDPALWGELPAEVLEEVVAKLPARTQARCRTLSRAWATLPPVPSLQTAPLAAVVCAFQQPSFENQQRQRMDGPEQEMPGFHGFFHDLDVTFLPPRFLNWQDGLTRVLSQSGLLCIAYRDWDLNELCICLVNPHNRTWRELPRLDWRRWSSYRYSSECEIKVVAADPGSSSFQVLVLTEILYSLTTLSVFSSADNSWTTTPHKFGLGVSMRVRRENRHAVCNNQLYGLVGVENRWEEMVVLDAGTGQELRRMKHLPHTGLTDVHLVEYQGKVVWVEREDDLPRIWVLNGRGDAGKEPLEEEWELIASMPEELLQRLRASSALLDEAGCGLFFEYQLRDVQLGGDIIFLNLVSKGQTHLVAYHLRHRSWQLILHDGRDNFDFHFLQPRVELRL